MLRPFFRTGAAAGATHSVASHQEKRRSRDSTRRIRKGKHQPADSPPVTSRNRRRPATTPPQTYDTPPHTCPEPRVKRASPEHLPASPLFTGISGHAWLKRPFHAGLRPTFIPRFAPVSARAVPIFYHTGAAAGATHSVASPQSKRRSRDSTRRIRRVKYRRLNPAAGSRRLTATPATTPPQYPPRTPRKMGFSGAPSRQPTVYAGFRTPLAETPIPRGFPGSLSANALLTRACGRLI